MTLKMSIEQQWNDSERGIVEKPTDAKYVPCMVIFFSYPLSISLVEQGLTGRSDFDVEVTRCQHSDNRGLLQYRGN